MSTQTDLAKLNINRFSTLEAFLAHTTPELGDYDLTLVGDIAVVVESYVNGDSWYRMWSDGWIEQGGVQTTTGTVNFLIPFSDANYTLVYGNTAGDGQSRTANTPITTGFTVSSGTNKGYQGWYACGY